MYKVACPNFGMLDLRTKHRVCTCCRHATKKNHHAKAEKNLKLTVHSKLLQNYFSCANIKMLRWTGKCPKFEQGVRSLGRVSEVQAGCPKFGHGTLFSVSIYLIRYLKQQEKMEISFHFFKNVNLTCWTYPFASQHYKKS